MAKKKAHRKPPKSKKVAKRKSRGTPRRRPKSPFAGAPASAVDHSGFAVVQAEDLVEGLRGRGGEPFQNMVHALVIAEAATHGVHAVDISADYVISRADGGRDIQVKRGHAFDNPRFVPQRPSIWSCKAGADGTKASTLRAELTDIKHRSLLDWIRAGNAYVWCSLLAGQLDRTKLEAERAKLAKKHGFSPACVEFRWNDGIAAAANWHLNLACAHLPRIAERLTGVSRVSQWVRESPECRVAWVNLNGRDDWKEKIRSHMLSAQLPSVMHVAGLSGVGKTRTAIEACIESDAASEALYVADFASIDNGPLLKHAQSSGNFLRLIVDEMSIDESVQLAQRFEGCPERVRILTIGPAKRQKSPVPAHQSILVMEEPEERGVLKIVQAAGRNLPPEVQSSIAKWSAHDLKLALFLVRVAIEDSTGNVMPFYGLDDVWDRVVRLFRKELENAPGFARAYETLTTAVDVGWKDEFREEIEYLSAHFGISLSELDRAIGSADSMGLGLRTPRFFEAVPRALAIWIFSDRAWTTVAGTVDKFVGGMKSERLRRRFLERCHEVTGPRREEVHDAVSRFFLKFLGQPHLLRLAEREVSRVFEAWAELDPERGLPWLVRAAESTSDDELRKFDGSNDWSGGWRGRRQIVWLCEHLACFDEYFWDCERVLFRLAQVETEERVGNNSLNTWREMFLPVLSNTEKPFPERWDRLIRRLLQANERTVDLVLSAITHTFEHHGFRSVPPAVVGGRIVPKAWRPETQSELREHKRTAAREFLASIAQLPTSFARRAVESVIDHFSRFAYLDVFTEMRTAFAVVADDEAIERRLRAQLDAAILWEERYREVPWPLVEPMRAWRAELQPRDIRAQIVDLTARDYWSVYDRAKETKTDHPDRVFGELADALHRDIALLEGLADWFESPSCKSGSQLGAEVGRFDLQARALPIVLTWLRQLRVLDFSAGYLTGLANRPSELPASAVSVLDELVQRRPTLAVQLSTRADHSARGFNRIMTCLQLLAPDERRVVQPLEWEPWPTLLSQDQQISMLTALEDLAKADGRQTLGIAVHLLASWTVHRKQPVPPALAPIALRLLQYRDAADHVQEYDWQLLIDSIADSYPEETLALAVPELLQYRSGRIHLRDYATKFFKKQAQIHPREAMDAIGQFLLAKEGTTDFRIGVHRGVFDSIGLPAVREWIEQHGAEFVPLIARHLDGPSVAPDGTPIVPELADWILTTFGDDEAVMGQFLTGRHSSEVRHGWARDRTAEVERLTTPFLKHSKRWVREWAKYEVREHERELEWDDEREDARERT